jgi:hypothetical protein
VSKGREHTVHSPCLIRKAWGGDASHLESILIAALLLAHLAIPAQLLQALGLDAIGDRLGRQEASALPHSLLLLFDVLLVGLIYFMISLDFIFIS